MLYPAQTTDDGARSLIDARADAGKARGRGGYMSAQDTGLALPLARLSLGLGIELVIGYSCGDFVSSQLQIKDGVEFIYIGVES